jgi:hypothetical protein
LKRPHKEQRNCRPGNHAYHRQPQRRMQNQTYYRFARRAQRKADAYLFGSPRNRVGHDVVDADAGEDEREQPEGRGKKGKEFFRVTRFIDLLLLGPEPEDREIVIESADALTYGSRDRGGVAAVVTVSPAASIISVRMKSPGWGGFFMGRMVFSFELLTSLLSPRRKSREATASRQAHAAHSLFLIPHRWSKTRLHDGFVRSPVGWHREFVCRAEREGEPPLPQSPAIPATL